MTLFVVIRCLHPTTLDNLSILAGICLLSFVKVGQALSQLLCSVTRLSDLPQASRFCQAASVTEVMAPICASFIITSQDHDEQNINVAQWAEHGLGAEWHNSAPDCAPLFLMPNFLCTSIGCFCLSCSILLPILSFQNSEGIFNQAIIKKNK